MRRLVVLGGVVVDQHPDDPRHRARHGDLARAQQRHVLEPEGARGDGGNSASRSSVTVKMQLTTCSGASRCCAAIACISSLVASRISAASLRSTLVAPRRANSRMGGDCVRASRARRRSTSSSRRRRCAPAASAPSVSGPKRTRTSDSDRMPDGLAHPAHLAVASLVDRQLDLLGCQAAHARGRRGAVLELDALAQRAQRRSAIAAAGEPHAVGLRRPRSGGGSGGWRARRRWSAGSARCCRRRGARPDTGAARAAGTRSSTVGRPCVSRAVETTPAGLFSAYTTRRSGARERAAVDRDVAGARRRRARGRSRSRRRRSRARPRSRPRRRAARRRRRGRGTWRGASLSGARARRFDPGRNHLLQP